MFLLFSLRLQLDQNQLYDDQLLLREVAEGDEAAYRKLYERYAGKVFSLGWQYLKSRSEAEDVVQEIFMKVWVKRSELPEVSNFNAWIHFVTKNLLIDKLRKKANEDKILPAEEESYDAGPDLLTEGKEIGSIIRDAINQLSPRQKEIYNLSREGGLKYYEIADKLNLSPSTVREHMKEALKNIRKYVKARLGILVVLIMQSL